MRGDLLEMNRKNLVVILINNLFEISTAELIDAQSSAA